jgi:tRNA-Thr(GGU) m(6)t(6)A37 methyltransferase TsaA
MFDPEIAMTIVSDGNPVSAIREGEIALPFDPAQVEADAGLVFIGRVLSPWKERAECPKNVVAARALGKPAAVEIDLPYRQALDGLEGASHIIVLTWLDRARRDLALQFPRHAERPRGTFALRSPVRPNPVGLHVVGLLGVDMDAGRLSIDAIDVLDGTPVIDIKPYYASTDSVPDAKRPSS